MAYGLNPRLFVENGPTIEAARSRQLSSTDGYRVWRNLRSEIRIELVDRALKSAANDEGIDGYPFAL